MAAITALLDAFGYPFHRRNKASRQSRRVLSKAIIETLEPRVLLSFTVTTNLDSSADNSMSGNPLCLRQAVLQADAAGGNQTIVFASTLTGSTINLVGSALALDDTTGTLTIQGPSAGSLTIDGPTHSAVITVHAGSTAVLQDLTVTGGSEGGISNSGNLTILASTITNNTNNYSGGGVFSNARSNLTITDSIISGNKSVNLWGGGVYTTVDAGLAISNSTISGNTAIWGGGILAYGSATIADSTISGNSASAGGGGIYTNNLLTVTDSTLASNTAGYSGGAISNFGNTTVTNSTFSGNLASGAAQNGYGGGAIDNEGNLTVKNSTFSTNTGGDGGAILANGVSSTITDSTLSGNSATGSGGGVSGTATLDGTIVANSTHGGDLSGIFSGDNNLVGDGSGGLSTFNNNLTGSAHLSALGYYGGPTETMALLTGSPALGHGASFGGLTTDQRGLGRPTSSPDIGAFQTGPLVVNTTQDSAAVGEGLLSLRQAITLANLDGGNQTITFASSLTSSGPATIDLSGTALSLDDTSGTLTIQGPGSALLTISGQGQSNIFDVDRGSTASISGLTVFDGNGSTDYGYGGGVNNAGTLTITDCVISGSTAITGGGIYDTGALTLTDSTISDNTGDGIYISPAGGTTTVQITDSIITGNSAAWGGGIANYRSTTITNSTISDNTATYGVGGGINNEGHLFITGSTLSGNVADDRGGGAIADAGQLTIENSTITGNTALGSLGTGGGIYTDGGYAITLLDSTISGNSAVSGGGITGSGTLQGSIIANNTGGDLADNFGGSFNGNDNLIGDGSGAISGSANIQGTKASPINPMLTILGNYGGLTQTMALLPGSPAIAESAIADRDTTDQRGFTRLNSTPDIGAFQTGPLVVNTTQDSAAAGEGLLSLRQAITLANLDGGNQTITFASSLTSSGPATIDLSGTALSLDDTSGTLTVQGPGSALLTISGQGQSNIFDVDRGSTASISGLTMTDGNAGSVHAYGGGIDVTGNLTLSGCVISGSTASNGGGIYISRIGTAAVQITDSVISGNTAAWGGGIADYRSTTITNSTITDNTATYGAGGGINSDGNLTLSDSTISGNSATRAVNFSNGGGIYSSGNLDITDSTISGNSTPGVGGGIDNAGTLTVVNSTIYGNSADDGGGINSRGTLTITDSTLSGNTAQSMGGGIQSTNSTAQELNGSIVAINSNAGDLSGLFTGGFNIIGDGTGGLDFRVGGAYAQNQIDNPQLVPLFNNGGPTETMALQSDSPAIGHGNTFAGITTDQRGNSRPTDDPDIGAFQTSQSLVVVGQTVAATSGQAFSANVALAIYPLGLDNGTEGNELTALINWQDGSITGGEISGGAVGFNVTGTHDYSNPGTYHPTITITARSPGGSPTYLATTATATVNVNPPLVTSFQVNDGSSQRTTVTSLTVNLSQALSLTSGSFELMETATTNSVSPHQEVVNAVSSNGGMTYTLTFPNDPGSELPNGTYTLTVLGFGASAGTQSNPQFTFYCESSGASDTATASLQSIPAASVGAPITINVNAAPYGNNGDLLSYQWSVTDENGHAFALQDSGVTSVPSLTFTPSGAGTWSVGVTVTDTDLSVSTSVSSQSFSVAAAGPSLLTATLGSTGVTNLTYNGWTYLNNSGVGSPTTFFSALVVDPNGNFVPETISSQWNSTTDTLTYSAHDFIVTVQYVPGQSQLGYNISAQNTSTTNTLEGIQFTLLYQMVVPSAISSSIAFGTQGPLFVTADATSNTGAGGVVALANQQQIPGYVQFNAGSVTESNGITYPTISPVFSTIPSWNNPTSWSSMISPVLPNQSATYNVSLRFGPTGTDTPLVQDINQAFSTQYPSTVQWNNRQQAEILFPTGVGGLNNLNQSSGQALTFAERLLNYGAAAIDQMLATGQQGMISWDIEGDPIIGQYVGDPTLATSLSPNLTQAMANLPQSEFSADVQKYYATLPAGSTLVDEYFAMFTSAGLKVGVTLRADQAAIDILGSTPGQDVVWHQFAADPAQLLIEKIEYAEQNWGATLFYIDSILPNEAGILAEVHAAVPNVLLIPEQQSVASFASGSAYGQVPVHDGPLALGSLDTASNVLDVYPDAFSVTRDGNANPNAVLTSGDLPAISEAAARGGTFLIDTGFGVNNLINTAFQALAFSDAIYTSATATQSLSNDVITLRADGPNMYEIVRDGLIMYSGQISSSSPLEFNFGGSNDTLVIDTSQGDPIPAGGLSFNGGTISNNNTLTVIGSDGNDSITFGNGTVTIGSSTVTFQDVANLVVDPRGGVDSLTVNAGNVLLPAQYPGHGILTRQFSNLTVAAGASLAVGTDSAPSDMTLITTASLVLAGTLDLGGNEMIVDYGSGADPISAIQALIKSGYNNGAWNGSGLNSSTAAASTHYALGYSDGADGVVAGLTSGQIEIKYTLYGDANLDGVVSGDDFTIMETHFSHQVTNGWDEGDFNYDGVVDGADFTLLDMN